MNFNIGQLDEKLQKAARNANGVLKMNFAEGGMRVTAHRVERGCSVTKKDGGAEIGYASVSDFLRAMLCLACGREVSQKRAFKELGVMIDCSRNAVPTVETVKETAALLACFGYTYIYLYTEDTYELENNPYFGYMRGRYTKEEIREIDTFCAEVGIELIPCIQTLAHLNQITRYKDYGEIIDCNDILLCGDERTYKLIDDMFSTIEHNFTSRKVNIGMDEAHMIGLGKYLSQHGYVKNFDIMLAHLRRVLDIAKKHGFSCSMWSDMFFRMAADGEYYKYFDKAPEELLGQIPEDVTLVYWDYYHTDYDHYVSMIESHKLLTDKITFAGGAWKWVGFAPLNAYSNLTAESAVPACRDCGIENYFVTSWGDNGAEALLSSVLPALYRLAQLSYDDGDNDELFRHATGVSYEDFMKLDLPNLPAEDKTKKNNSCKFFLYDDLLFGTFDSLIEEGQTEKYVQVENALRSVKGGRYAYLFRELADLCAVLETKVKLAVELKKAYAEKDKVRLATLSADFKTLLSRIDKFYKSFAAAWAKENKPFGFEVQDIRIGGLIARVKAVAGKVAAFAAGKTESIPELDEKHLPYGCFGGETSFEDLFFNSWGHNVTASIL